MFIVGAYTQKGGSGKTATLYQLATGLANSGKRVLLLDIDKSRNFQQWMIAGKDLNSWTDKFTVKYQDGRKINQGDLENVLQTLDDSGDFDFCLANFPGNSDDGAGHILKYCDLVLLPVNLGLEETSDIPVTYKSLQDFRETDDFVGEVRLVYSDVKFASKDLKDGSASKKLSAGRRHAFEELSDANLPTLNTVLKNQEVVKDFREHGYLPVTVEQFKKQGAVNTPRKVSLGICNDFANEVLELEKELLTLWGENEE